MCGKREKVRCVVQMIQSAFFLSTVAEDATEFGSQNTWEQAPGVPATPKPSMTKNSSSSRAHLALNVRMDGARKMA